MGADSDSTALDPLPLAGLLSGISVRGCVDSSCCLMCQGGLVLIEGFLFSEEKGREEWGRRSEGGNGRTGGSGGYTQNIK